MMIAALVKVLWCRFDNQGRDRSRRLCNSGKWPDEMNFALDRSDSDRKRVLVLQYRDYDSFEVTG
jgi:hypothetical protein